jgi:hypothetical protein
MMLQSLNSSDLRWILRAHNLPRTARISRKMKIVSTITSFAPRGFPLIGMMPPILAVVLGHRKSSVFSIGLQVPPQSQQLVQKPLADLGKRRLVCTALSAVKSDECGRNFNISISTRHLNLFKATRRDLDPGFGASTVRRRKPTSTTT